jgi:hypothetical protein
MVMEYSVGLVLHGIYVVISLHRRNARRCVCNGAVRDVT